MGYRLPYMWSQMSIAKDQGRVIYRARRRWPTARGASSVLAIRRALPVDEVSELDAFLTARWGLYTSLGSHVAYAPVEHAPWPLEHGHLEYLDDELVAAAGYEVPDVPPLIHYSRGVEVRIGLPRRVVS